MSRLTDYSKFDHLTEESDDDENEQIIQEASTKTTTTASAARPKSSDNPTTNSKNAGGLIRRDERSGRYRFEYAGNTVYEFEQNLDEMTIYVLPPPWVTKGHQINCIIAANHLKLALAGGPWYLNEGTYGTVDTDESTWTLEDYDGDDNKNGGPRKIIVITLIKANRGTLWEAALRGRPDAGGATNKTKTGASTTMDALAKEQVKKDLMLQRFQEENPGFDFSGADFNGSVPNAREFMGGVKYQ